MCITPLSVDNSCQADTPINTKSLPNCYAGVPRAARKRQIPFVLYCFFILFLFAKLFFQFANSKLILRFQFYFFQGMIFCLQHFLSLRFYFYSSSFRFSISTLYCALVICDAINKTTNSIKTISITSPPHLQSLALHSRCVCFVFVFAL